MTNITQLDSGFKVGLCIRVRYCFHLTLAFQGHTAPTRQFTQSVTLYRYQICEKKRQRRGLTVSRRITRSSQTIHGILFLKYWNASSREGQMSRREDVAATAKSMADMRSSSSELNTSRVTIVASIRTMAANVEGGISLVVSILRQVALVAKRRGEKKEWNCGADRKWDARGRKASRVVSL